MPPTGSTSTRRDTLDRVCMPVSSTTERVPSRTAPPDRRESAGPSPSLDRPETNRQIDISHLRTVNTEELERPVTFRHSGWARARTQVRNALAALGGRDARLERWDCCGAHPWLVRSVLEPLVYRIHADLCHDRFCKPCASARSAIIAANLAEKMAERRHRLITLTIRSGQEPLAQLLNLLYDSFRLLRKTDLWRTRIRGGACFLEIKYNRDLDRWHPHLHIIAEGQYIEQGHLTQAWQRITKYSCIVDVRLIKTQDQAVRYVTKYASKPLSSSYLGDHDRLCEAVTALTGRRLCMTFGVWRGWKLLKSPTNGPWTRIGDLSCIVSQASWGNAYHIQLLANVGLKVKLRPRDHAPTRGPPPAECYLWGTS